MTEDVMIAAIGEQMKALSTLLSTTIGIALVALWAGLKPKGKIPVLSLEVTREHAFYLLGVGFMGVNAAGIVYFLRLTDLLVRINPGYFCKAVATLATSGWLANPFSFFGQSPVAVLHGGAGLLLIIAMWWIGLATLSLLAQGRWLGRHWLVMFGYIALGLASLGAIFAVLCVAARGLGDSPATLLARWYVFWPISAGGIIGCWLPYRRLWRDSSPRPHSSSDDGNSVSS
jgi:hypothetical protein